MWRLINNRPATKSYISEVDRDCQVSPDVTSIYVAEREGVSLTYTVRDGAHRSSADRARWTVQRESLNIDNNYHTDEIAVTTDH